MFPLTEARSTPIYQSIAREIAESAALDHDGDVATLFRDSFEGQLVDEGWPEVVAHHEVAALDAAARSNSDEPS